MKVMMPAINAFDSVLERLMFRSFIWGIIYCTLRKPGHPSGCPAVLMCVSTRSVLDHKSAVSTTDLVQLCHVGIANLERLDAVIATSLE